MEITESGCRALFNNDHIVMLLIDPDDLNIIEANKAACKFYGFEAGDFKDRQIFHISMLSEEEIRAEIKKARNKEQYHFLSRHRLAGNEICDVEVTIIPVIHEEKTLFCFVVHALAEIKNVAEKFRYDDDQYKSLFLEAPISIIIHDKDSGEIIDANIKAYKSFGYSSFEQLKTTSGWLEPPYSFNEAREMLHKAVLEGPQEYEWLHRKNTGELFWFNVRLSPVMINGVQRVISMSVDITARKKAESRFAEETTRRRILVEQSNDGIVVVNGKGKVIEANQKYADMLGYSMDEVLQLYAWDWDNQWTPEETIEIIRNVDESGLTFETSHRRKDGTFIDVEVSSNGAILGGQKLAFCVCRDITDRKRAEALLKQTEQKYRQTSELLQKVIESPKDVVILALDNNYRYIAFNKYHQETMKLMWGCDIDFGVSILDCITDPLDMERVKANFDRTLAGEFFTIMEEYGNSLLEKRWFESVYSPLKDDEENVIGFTLLVTDVTERKQTEMALLQAKAIAEESNLIKSEFIANMSHELRTPLNSVIGFSHVLIDKPYGNLNEKQLKYVSNILKSGNHLLELINTILDVSRIESGNMEYIPERVNLHEVMNEVILLMAPQIKEKNIGFTTNIEFDKLEMDADKLKLKQILYNLLSNAIKFTDSNGTVCFDSKICSGDVYISVSDTGIGISPQQQQTIFDPFKQINSSINRAHGGTGLGLAIVKHYVKMHSGEVYVESEVGKGSTFTITIPINN